MVKEQDNYVNPLGFFSLDTLLANLFTVKIKGTYEVFINLFIISQLEDLPHAFF